MDYFVELTNGQITKRVKRGTAYKNTSFGKNAPDTTYTDLGLYKEVRLSPTLSDNQKYGNEIITIDDINKTYTLSKEVIELTQEELLSNISDDITKAVRRYLNDTASQYKFDDIRSARAQSSVNVPNIANQRVKAVMDSISQKAIKLAEWELECWATLSIIEEDVINGVISAPTAEEVITQLPTLSMV